ncbi:DUF1178 family protein [Pukyongiella litopenaei]|uniref:DUF1178 family protein n=1 Tax=Pukyongiella litopenaei TaxID=2605946 RepID=A0A2S0MLI6_9RHOB|nr:DUF1178 family protein [Pukyongiella litopenaei]AVO36748.1 DUF1178 family protein [Pukyongiella litopenaei]
MIQYTLKCAGGHAFDSWFQSADAYEKLHAAGMVACAVCGGADVTKAIMAPRVSAARSRADSAPATSAPATSGQGALTAPASPAEQAIRLLREKIESSSEYVGMSFADEARAIHEGSAPERAIHGEAKPAEARRLIEEGVPVAPLPFLPHRKSN